ncbi:MAG TPA: putative toxin-antitoxin system toxin component, PIN family [Tepidiformaceae bacterium]|nr:putative toxin-antitoxin system toxin component, PIN family [Tepidiformaceae bacterium]
MNIVVDANIYVSAAINPGGLAERALTGTIDAGHALHVSALILQEVRRAFLRDNVRVRRRFDTTRVEQLMGDLNESVVDDDYPLPETLGLRDSSGAHLVRLALVCHADLIVSADKDLLTLGSIEGIPVVDIHAFAYTLGLRH